MGVAYALAAGSLSHEREQGAPACGMIRLPVTSFAVVDYSTIYAHTNLPSHRPHSDSQLDLRRFLADNSVLIIFAMLEENFVGARH